MENKQIYNKSHCIYDFGSQEILSFYIVGNFHIFCASLSRPHSSHDFGIFFRRSAEVAVIISNAVQNLTRNKLTLVKT